MPQVRRASPMSLLALCLDNVTRISFMEAYCQQHCSEKNEENGVAKKRRLNFVNPFEEFPSLLLEKIIETLRKKDLNETEKRPIEQYLELLISSQLRILHVSSSLVKFCPGRKSYRYLLRCERLRGERIGHLISLASIHCPRLEILRLMGLNELAEDVYLNLIPSFGNLQILDVSYTNTGDRCLHLLGTFCKDLKELDITKCPMTDDGIQGLCVSVDCSGIYSEKVGRCKSINKLMIRGTKITLLGCQLALQNLPHLTLFDCGFSAQVLAKMHQEALQRGQSEFPKFSLIALYHHASKELPYVSGSLKLAASLCHSTIVKLEIDIVSGLTDTDLLGLLVLKELKELRIKGCCDENGVQISFDGGVAPVLKSVGGSLNSLILTNLYICINLHTIAEYCSELRLLFLTDNDSYMLATNFLLSQSYTCFEKLETMHLERSPDFLMAFEGINETEHLDLISTDMLFLLLSSPYLKNVVIESYTCLTDNFLREAANLHGFPNLERIALRNCSSVTKEGINVFMNEKNPLRSITLSYCESLTKENFGEWNEKIEDKKWDLVIGQY